MSFSPIISAKELSAILFQENLILIDAGSGTLAYERYLKEHIASAIYVDLNEDLAAVPEDASEGGRHPLPSPKQFAALLQRLGISKKSRIIVYDDKNGSNAAARFWWMVRAAGLRQIQVLDGGLQAAKEAQLPITDTITTPQKTELIDFATWQLPTADLQLMTQLSPDNQSLIIDVREPERYRGISEPIDLIAGHIPGAINIPFKDNLQQDGTFKNPGQLRVMYEPILASTPSEKAVVHCGSGVTACHTLLAIDYAGLPLPKLYVGSWSEWSRNDLPITTDLPH